jgi:hypothetical protein
VNLHVSPGRCVSLVAVAGALSACALPPKSPASALPPASLDDGAPLPADPLPSVALGCEYLPQYAAPDDVPTVPLALHLQIDVSGWYVLGRTCVVLDGARLFAMVRRAENPGGHARVDWPTRVTRGEHAIGLILLFDGASEFEGSRVAAGFHFEVKSSHSFATQNENGISVAARGYELNSGPLEQRLTVSWLETPIP